MKKENVSQLCLKDVCILDPAAKDTLTTADCRKFKYLVFGGILGDYPPRQRTKDLLTSKLPNAGKRNLGKEQFPTDNAVYVARQIEKGKRFNELKFTENIEVEIGKNLSVRLPFKYALKDGKPLLPDGLKEYLKIRGTI